MISFARMVNASLERVSSGQTDAYRGATQIRPVCTKREGEGVNDEAGEGRKEASDLVL